MHGHTGLDLTTLSLQSYDGYRVDNQFMHQFNSYINSISPENEQTWLNIDHQQYIFILHFIVGAANINCGVIFHDIWQCLPACCVS